MYCFYEIVLISIANEECQIVDMVLGFLLLSEILWQVMKLVNTFDLNNAMGWLCNSILAYGIFINLSLHL